MPPVIPSTEPQSFAAGETVQWRRSYGDYSPADGWDLTYYFAGASIFNVTAEAVNGEWLVTIQPGDTRKKKAGTYRWTAYADNADGERRRIDSGTVRLEADITKAADGELSPFCELALPIIEAALTNRLTVDQQAFQIDGTAITNIPIVELKQLRAQFRSELWRLRNPGKVGQPILMSFGGVR